MTYISQIDHAVHEELYEVISFPFLFVFFHISSEDFNYSCKYKFSTNSTFNIDITSYSEMLIEKNKAKKRMMKSKNGEERIHYRSFFLLFNFFCSIHFSKLLMTIQWWEKPYIRHFILVQTVMNSGWLSKGAKFIIFRSELTNNVTNIAFISLKKCWRISLIGIIVKSAATLKWNKEEEKKTRSIQIMNSQSMIFDNESSMQMKILICFRF